MTVCCCSRPVHFTLTAHQLLARQRVDSTDSSLVYTTPNANFSLHQVCVLYFMHVTVVSIIPFIACCTSRLLVTDDHSFRLLWSDMYCTVSHCCFTPYGMSRCPCAMCQPHLFGLMLFNMILHQCHPGRFLWCIYYVAAGYLEVQVRTRCHLMLLLSKPATVNAAKCLIH